MPTAVARFKLRTLAAVIGIVTAVAAKRAPGYTGFAELKYFPHADGRGAKDGVQWPPMERK